ncbi:MAG TPA: cyclic peptide export ABC transporter [Blastocatellia bacterium]|nr:cyclic peptide export ABC transporter [Blastocatellia bacterium]
MVLIIASGVLAGLGNTALIGVINAILLGAPGSRMRLLAMFVGLCLFIPASAYISQVLLVRLTARAAYDIRRRLCRQMLSAPFRVLEELGTHRLFATLTDDISAVTTTISSLPVLLAQLAIIAGCLAYLGWLSRPLLLSVIIYMAVGILSYQVPFAKALTHFRALREEWDALFKSLRALTDGSKELKLHGARRRAFFAQQLDPDMEAIRRLSVSGSSYSFAAANLGQVLFFIFIGLVLFVSPIFFSVDRHVLTGYALTILYMNGPLAAVLNTLPNLGRAQVAFRKIEALGLSLGNQSSEPEAAPLSGPAPPWRRLDLIGITHQYKSDQGAHSFTVGPLDLSFRPGELIFLIGGNGSGKTTLAKLLAGLYAPESGEIRLDGAPVANHNRDQYRQNFTAIFSDYFLFDRLLGIDSENQSARAQYYLTRLQLDHKVEVADGRLSSLDLSSGQRKRLALLTAYLEDRSLYIFDEWAADQDPVFKRFFYCEILPELKAAGKTLIVISHDDRFYHLADRIIKLESGQLEYDKRPEPSGRMEREMATPTA